MVCAHGLRALQARRPGAEDWRCYGVKAPLVHLPGEAPADLETQLSVYTEKVNPYKQRHMRRAFRMGWEAAERGINLREAQERAGRATANRATRAGWWRGFYTQRGEY